MTKKLSIAIIGGGAAGYFAAAAITRNCPGTEVTILYDPNTPSIGVGESLSWGSPGFMSLYLGLHNNFKWMRMSGSTFKYSVALKDFDKENGDLYHLSAPYHPSYKSLYRSAWTSANQLKYHQHDNEPNLFSVMLHLKAKGMIDDNFMQYNNEYYWYAFYNTCHITKKGEWSTNDWAGGYSYHINAEKIAPVIHELIGKPNGVKDFAAAVRHVVLDEQGNVDHLLLDNDQKFFADLYIDASGQKRILIKNLPFEWQDWDEYFNDTALVGQYPIQDYSEYNSMTLSCAMRYGWRFQIPIVGRTGNGYVYNSKIFDKEDVLIDEFIEKTGKKNIQLRKLKWDPGYYRKSFVKNCIALGLSAGFSDVFDANAFSNTLRHVAKMIDLLKEDPARTFSWKDTYNQFVHETNESIRLRIQSSFHLAQRNDTVYWQAMKEAAQKFKTKDQLIEACLDPAMRVWPVFPNTDSRTYSNTMFINMANYNGIEIPPERCILPEIDEYTEQQALLWFNWFRDSYRLRAQHAQPMSKFYQHVYPELGTFENLNVPEFYTDFLG